MIPTARSRHLSGWILGQLPHMSGSTGGVVLLEGFSRWKGLGDSDTLGLCDMDHCVVHGVNIIFVGLSTSLP